MNPGPMAILREQAEKKLRDSAQRLVAARQVWQQASDQLQQLKTYQCEYQQQLQRDVHINGVTVMALTGRQAFISSLGNAIARQTDTLATQKQAVDRALLSWQHDHQRLNAFETLISRAAQAAEKKARRLEQKMMDEFARIAGVKSETL